MLLKIVFGLVYWTLYLLTLPLRLVVYLKRAPVRAFKEQAGRRDYTNNRRQSEFGAYAPVAAGQPNPYVNCSPDADLILPLAKEGVGSERPETICDFFKRAVTRHGGRPALMWQADKDAQFKCWTWLEYYQDCQTAARALIKLGMRRFESVNILGFNSPEWFIANLGAILAGGKAAGIYPTNDALACEYITEHSEARAVVVEDMMQLNKYADNHQRLPNVSAYIIYRPPADFASRRPNFGAARVLTWDEFMALGAQAADRDELEHELEQRIAALSPGNCSTLIYTSGTTGQPKAVMISHDNLTWTARMIMGVIPNVGTTEESWISYLPLSHVAAQMLDIHGPIVMSATAQNPCTVWFARPDALRGSLKDTLLAARPTIFFGVPRVWEKFKEGMQAIKKSPLETLIADWAKSVGFAKFQSEQLGSTVEPPLSYPLARLLFNKIKARLGLDRCRYCISGAAPISQDVLNYFGSLDINIHQVYGMSECTGPATLDLPDITKTGSCGHSLPGVEIKLVHQSGRDRPDEGEVCYRGRNIMMGYMKDPAKTAEAIDSEGWLHSGDLGKLDNNGFLYITGRIKELIITAGGENIAPVPIEDEIKEILPAIANVMMIGDRRKFCTALITLKTEPDHDTGGFTDRLYNEATRVDPSCTTVAQAKASEKWHQYIDAGLRKYNQHAVSNAQKIQKFRILDEDFSVANGDLTATLKLKRSVCSEKYAVIIDSMYDDEQ